MQTNDHQIRNFSDVLDAEIGLPGIPQRIEAEERAYAFYIGQIIEDARKKAKITQAELASRIGSNRSYILWVEKGIKEPRISTF